MSLPESSHDIEQVYTISSGKFRRYHGESFWSHLADLKTIFLNIRDVFLVLAGIWQSYWLLGRLKPQIVFVKGGFVGLPVGIAAHWRNIPIVTHDSDIIPGLTNRIVSRWAVAQATGMPAELYSYPEATTVHTGVPVGKAFQPATPTRTAAAKKALKLPAKSKVVLVVGGGLGSQRINELLLEIAPQLLEPKSVNLFHITGGDHQSSVQAAYDSHLDKQQLKRLEVIGFTDKLADYGTAADVVVTRAGATALADFEALRKACVVIPNGHLTGGHQLKNAQVLRDEEAAIIFDEEHPAEDLLKLLQQLLNNPAQRAALAERFGRLAVVDAPERVAKLLLSNLKTES